MAESARQAAEWRIIEKAWKNEDFRKQLLADPNGAVSRELGTSLPAGVKVRVVEETADTFVLVIPARADNAPAGKLSMEDLESVAGGWEVATVTAGLC